MKIRLWYIFIEELPRIVWARVSTPPSPSPPLLGNAQFFLLGAPLIWVYEARVCRFSTDYGIPLHWACKLVQNIYFLAPAHLLLAFFQNLLIYRFGRAFFAPNFTDCVLFLSPLKSWPNYMIACKRTFLSHPAAKFAVCVLGFVSDILDLALDFLGLCSILLPNSQDLTS